MRLSRQRRSIRSKSFALSLISNVRIMEKYSYIIDLSDKKPTWLVDTIYFQKKKMKSLCLTTLVALFSAIGCFYYRDQFYVITLCVASALLFHHLVLWMQARSLAKRTHKTKESKIFKYTIDDSGIHWEHILGNGTINWGLKGELINSREYTLLNLKSYHTFPIPKDCPASVINFIREKIK